jgi:hypothetical protein
MSPGFASSFISRKRGTASPRSLSAAVVDRRFTQQRALVNRASGAPLREIKEEPQAGDIRGGEHPAACSPALNDTPPKHQCQEHQRNEMTRLVAIDWGTSSLRGALLDADGKVLEERSDARGILTVPEGGFPAVFEALFGDWMRGRRAVPHLRHGRQQAGLGRGALLRVPRGPRGSGPQDHRHRRHSRCAHRDRARPERRARRRARRDARRRGADLRRHVDHRPGRRRVRAARHAQQMGPR